MSRIAAVWKASPAKVVAALFALFAAAAMAVGTGANFNATSANPSNLFTAGNLAHTNSKSGAAVLTAAKMKPGDSQTGTVDIKNTGDIPGVFTLSKSNVSDAPASPAFSGKLDLKVEDLGDPAAPLATPVVKYTGKLGSLPATALGTYAADETHRYRFTVTFPDGGSNGADNAYKGASSSVEFDWESASS